MVVKLGSGRQICLAMDTYTLLNWQMVVQISDFLSHDLLLWDVCSLLTVGLVAEWPVSTWSRW